MLEEIAEDLGSFVFKLKTLDLAVRSAGES